MDATTRKIAGIAGSALMLTGMGTGAAVAFADELPSQATTSELQQAEQSSMQETVLVKDVIGTFSFTQLTASSKEAIHKTMASAGKYLCGNSPIADPGEDVSDWAISIEGLVENPYTTTIGEIQNDDELMTQLMGCACAGNPADGAASVNAEVTGIAVGTLLGRAGVSADVNTIVFVSSDGYQVALPYTYLQTRLCPVVFNVAGAPIVESMGGANQLWLGSTSANYFARDIVSIRAEHRDVVPAAPGTPEAGDSYANLPNIGVAFGGEVV